MFQKNYTPWNYNGGRYLHQGYYYILKPDYYKTDNDGYVREHVYVYETYHKCCILKWGVVHHRDENRKNNDISNLHGMMRSNHVTLHNTGKSRKIDMSNRICQKCSNKTYINKNGWENWYLSDDKLGFICMKCDRKRSYYKNKK